MARAPSERSILFFIAAVQFVNVLDFIMVMPLGPDFARALGIPASELGLIGGSYTAAASVSGLLGSMFLDRFDRRSALAVALFGLAVGTVLGGFATGMTSLVAARVFAGIFGGPATSLGYSIVADVIPPERRGRAMGVVMGAFSIASILGVPAGLELAQRGGWRLPFFAVGALCALVTAAMPRFLPPMRAHLAAGARAPGSEPGLFAILLRPLVLVSFVMTMLAMFGSFILVPNISAYVQFNLSYPREHLGRLYLVGGAVSFVAMRLVGRLVDALGPARTGSFGAAWLLGVLYVGFLHETSVVPVPVLFMLFMGAMAFRNVSHSSLASRVPEPAERARFMSLQSAVQHLASALGAIASARMLRELPGGALEGVGRVTMVAMACTVLVPPLLFVVEARVRRRERAAEPFPAAA